MPIDCPVDFIHPVVRILPARARSGGGHAAGPVSRIVVATGVPVV